MENNDSIFFTENNDSLNYFSNSEIDKPKFVDLKTIQQVNGVTALMAVYAACFHNLGVSLE
jgi:hypothetical protein